MRAHLILLSLSLACYSDIKTSVYNALPEVQITSHPDKIELNEMEEVIFFAQVSDANNKIDELEVSWIVDEETICDWQIPEVSGLSTCSIQFLEGMERVSAIVRDPSGAAGTAIVDVQVILSTPPEVTLISPLSSHRYYSNTQISFEAQLSDVDESAQELYVEWTSSLDGTLSFPQNIDNNGIFHGATLLSEGEHYIELNVTDRANKTTSLSQIINVGPPNQTPECTFDTPTDGIGVHKGEEILFSGTATDAEIPSEDLIIRWISNIDGVFGQSYADSIGKISFSYDGLAVGTHTVTLHVEDDAGAVCSHNMLVHVGTPPQLTISNPLDGAILRYGEPFLIEGTIIDYEDPTEDISFTWTSSLDGELSTDGADSNGHISLSLPPISAGIHNIHVVAEDPIGLFTSDTINITINQVPNAPTVDLTPQPATSGDDLEAIASGSLDPEGNTISYKYAWYQDNVITSFTGATIPYTHTAKGEIWTVRVTPSDGIHQGPYTEASVIIGNSPPEADSLTITPNIAYNHDTLTCTGVSSDIDGDSIMESYSWRVGTTTIGTGNTINLSTFSYAPGQNITCVFSLTDGINQSEHTTTVQLSNHTPVIQSITISPAPSFNDSTLSCVVNATDNDGDVLTRSISWYNAQNNQFLSSNELFTLDSSVLHPFESIRCEVTVQDPTGATTSGSQSVTLENRSPSINSVEFAPNDLQMNTSIDCIADVTEPDNDSVTTTYEWQNLTTGTIIGNSQTLELEFSMGTGSDEILCTATSTDIFGYTSTSTVQGVINRTKPEFDVDAHMTPEEVDTNSLVTCAAHAIDPDGTNVTLSYNWKNQSTGAILGTTNTIQLSPFLVSPTDVLVCNVIATDGNQETEISSIATEIINTPPALSNISITPSTAVFNEETLTCSVSVFDADGEIIAPSFVWYNNNTPVGFGASLVLTPNIAMPGDSIRCEVEATDSYGASTQHDHSVYIDNRPPVLDSISIQASSLFNDSTLSCLVSYSDPDQENVHVQYNWRNSSTGLVLGLNSSLTLDSSMGSPQDSIECVVTLTDDFGSTTSGQSNIILANRVPNTPVVSISPNTLHIDSTISCDAVATDPDNDPLQYTYSWRKNGALIPPTTKTISASVFAVGDSFVCTSVVSDGLATASATSSSKTIENKPPEILGLAFNTQTLYTNDVLGMSYSSVDADGDSITLKHNWSVNGTVVQSGIATTLNGNTHFDKGDTIVLEVVAEDGINPPQMQSISINCLNSLPTGQTLSMVNHVVEGEDDLICSIDTPATDLDGDSIYYQFSWFVDGTPFSQTTDFSQSSVVSASDVQAEEIWTCSVDSLDVDGTGSNAQVSTVVVEPWTGMRSFSSCGAEGHRGPSQINCETAYSNDALNREVLVHNGAQSWIVPQDGNYLIEAYGAAGGSTANASGGLGAYMSGEFALSFGDTLIIYVGQPGADTQSGGAGGGGASIVVHNGSPILVAGGGGGAWQTGTKFADGISATISTSGTSGTTGFLSTGPIGGQSGHGGDGADGSGGAGLFGNGNGPFAGLSLSNGMLGNSTQIFGGFGGGAGAAVGISAGGGGGYSGGGGGAANANLGSGGGGGSYNIGSSQFNTIDASTVGSITIDLIP